MIELVFDEYKKVDELPEITNPAIYTSNKHDIFRKDSLYSEQIFGPVNNYKCQCGKLFGRINDKKVCEFCGVECGRNDKRNKQFAKIVFPNNIYVVNPIFKNALSEVFGFNAVKNLLNKFQYNANKENPYFFSLSKHKLIRFSKLSQKEQEKALLDFPVFDINSLKNLFMFLKDQMIDDCYSIDQETGEITQNKDIEPQYIYRHFITDKIKEEFTDFIFLNSILVTPPNSRQVIKISSVKIIPHPISKAYIEILKNISKGTSIMDNLYNANSDFFGNTVYKYQSSVDAIYNEILQFNFQKPKNYVRESLTGKTIEFSQRAVIVPNPVLKPYQIGLSEESVKKLFIPDLLRFLFKKYEDQEIEIITKTGDTKAIHIVDYIQYIYDRFNEDFELDINDEDFENFLKENINEFKLVVERQPNLYKWSISGYLLAHVFGDSYGEELNMPELNQMNDFERKCYFEAMEEAPKYIREAIANNKPMAKILSKNIKITINKLYNEKVKGILNDDD